jgi:hypothetical protein
MESVELVDQGFHGFAEPSGRLYDLFARKTIAANDAARRTASFRLFYKK